MLSPEQFNPLIREIMATFNRQDKSKTCNKNENSNSNNTNINIDPSQALVIAGILGGVLEVDSVLVGRDQAIEITLIGTLKRKTPLDKLMDQVGNLPFDQVMGAMLERLI